MALVGAVFTIPAHFRYLFRTCCAPTPQHVTVKSNPTWKRRLLSVDFKAKWDSQAFDFEPCVKVHAASKEGLDTSRSFPTNMAPFLVVQTESNHTETGISEEPLFAFFMSAGLVKRDERCCHLAYRAALGCSLDAHEGETHSSTVGCDKPTAEETLINEHWENPLTQKAWSNYSTYIKSWQQPAPREYTVRCALLCSRQSVCSLLPTCACFRFPLRAKRISLSTFHFSRNANH